MLVLAAKESECLASGSCLVNNSDENQQTRCSHDYKHPKCDSRQERVTNCFERNRGGCRERCCFRHHALGSCSLQLLALLVLPLESSFALPLDSEPFLKFFRLSSPSCRFSFCAVLFICFFPQSPLFFSLNVRNTSLSLFQNPVLGGLKTTLLFHTLLRFTLLF
jgi:hypothetical protein